jgi:hypothetical protein
VDITKAIVDTSNEMFRELLKNELFVLQKRTENKHWKDFFLEQEVSLSEKIIHISDTETKVKETVLEIMGKNPFGILGGMNVVANTAGKAADGIGKAFDGLNKATDGKLGLLRTGASAIGNLAGKAVDAGSKAVEGKHLQGLSGNEAEKDNLKKAIKELLLSCDFDKYIADFSTAIKEEFKKSLTVESIVSLQENMLMLIYKWYRENGFEVREEASDNIGVDTSIALSDEIFFQYPN